MLKNYEFIINLRKRKYQNIVLTKKDIFKRYKLIQSILNFKPINQSLNLNNSCCKKNFFKENLNKTNYLKFYKKFNVNLKLKNKYDLKTFKKKTNVDTCFCSYIHLSIFIIKSKKINDIHKLNTILKINDLLILLFYKKRNQSKIINFKKVLLYEKKLLNKFI